VAHRCGSSIASFKALRQDARKRAFHDRFYIRYEAVIWNMRVLITSPEISKQGGVANYVGILRRYLDAQVDLCVVGGRDHQESWWNVLSRLIADSLGFYRKTGEQSWDIVHLNPSLAWKAVIRDGILLYIAKRRGLKTVVSFHGWSKRFEACLTGRRLRWFQRIYFSADAMVVLARQFEQVLRAWGYARPVYLETTMVADELLEHFVMEDRLAANPRCATSLLFLARVERDKGIYETIDAFRLLKGRHSGLRLMIAGDGAGLPASQAYVRRLGIEGVEFLGNLRGVQKVEAFRNADVYVLPSFHGEGMPTSIAEAMVFGLPVVTRAVGGLRDFFADGTMGFMTESTDCRVLARLIERLVVDPGLRDQISRYNHEYAKTHFLASCVARRMESVYRSVVQEVPGAEHVVFPTGAGACCATVRVSAGARRGEETRVH